MTLMKKILYDILIGPGFKNTTTRGSKIIEIPLNQDGTFGTFEITGINLSLGEYSVIILTKSDSFSDSTIMGSIEVNYNNGEDFYSFDTADTIYGRYIEYEGTTIDNNNNYRVLFSPKIDI